jgi:hypothetical protein
MVYLCIISEFFDECLHIARLYMSEYSDAHLYSLGYIFLEKISLTLTSEGKGSEVVRGTWFVVHGSWFVVRGSWYMVLGTWFVVYPRCTKYSVLSTMYQVLTSNF